MWSYQIINCIVIQFTLIADKTVALNWTQHTTKHDSLEDIKLQQKQNASLHLLIYQIGLKRARSVVTQLTSKHPAAGGYQLPNISRRVKDIAFHTLNVSVREYVCLCVSVYLLVSKKLVARLKRYVLCVCCVHLYRQFPSVACQHFLSLILLWFRD